MAVAYAQREQRVYYHFSTTNKSFLEMHYFLKRKGITNNKFHLALYDPDLAAVDPYDPNISEEMKARVIIELRQNFWYFIREVVHIPVPGGFNVYGLHRGNLALSWCLVNNMNSIIELPRQNGKSISVCVFYLWLYNFATVNSELMLMNKKFEDSRMNLRRIKEIRETLPPYLQFIDMNDKNNTEVLESAMNKNKLVAKSAASNEVAADSLGRGCTQPCQWYDEIAFLKYNKIIYA